MTPDQYKDIREHERAGLITIRRHPFCDLEICNYTPKTQYTRAWDETTLMSRGLILDGGHNILARPFPKFFNMNETPETDITVLTHMTPTIFEKLEGVLGILYPERDKIAVSTRGAFTSPYAMWATHWLRKRCYTLSDFKADYTYCVEIVYPGSRIVVDYEDRAELVLLAVIHTRDRTELDIADEATRLRLPYAREYELGTLESAQRYLETTDGTTHEGFVCSYPNGLRVKLKSDDYKRLHKVVTGLTSRTLWNALRTHAPIEELLTVIPDEYYKWVHTTVAALNAEHAAIMKQAETLYEDTREIPSRKEQARAIRAASRANKNVQGIVFNMLDGHTERAEDAAWRMVMPPSGEQAAIE